MKKNLIAACALATAFAAGAQPNNTYSSPFQISENQELPRSVFVSYRNQQEAFQNDFSTSQNFIDLNGTWSFRYFPSEDAVPRAALQSEFSADGWSTVTLPGAWQLNGHGRTGDAVYQERSYAFASVAPVPPRMGESAVGVYSRRFIVPFDLFDKAHFLHVGAVKSGVKVYINGQEVGFSMADSKNPAEFDITTYITEGQNWITLIVPQNTPGNYMESHAEWQLYGINRDIFVFAQPKIRVRDFLVRTTLDPTYSNGLLETALLLKTQLVNRHKVTVYYDLYDPNGELVNKNFKDVELDMRSEDTVRFTASIPNVAKWNAETPNLYTILYRVQREGRFTEYATCQVGFRTVEVDGENLLLNGQPLIIKGVNVAEFNSQTGNTVDPAQMRAMLEEIKLTGFNAVRTNGYPMPNSFYQVCDQIGLYVCDVANINTSATGRSIYKGGTLSNDPAWAQPYQARINAMFERNKNHPSIIMWALGDRSGNGYNMYEAYLSLQSKDRTRPIVSDGANMEWNTDIYCPTYPSNLNNISGRPLIPSRVAWDPKYWGDSTSGAFLDVWNDLTLSAPVGGGKYTLFSDYKRAENNGRPQTFWASPMREQIAKEMAHVVITPVDPSKGVYRFENRLQFTDLDRVPISYQIVANGKVSKSGIVTVSARPGESVEVSIPGAGSSLLKGRGSNRQLIIRAGNLAEVKF